MFILIRKEPNGTNYIDKDNAIYYETLEMGQPPYNYTKVEIPDEFQDCEGVDFNEDLTFNVEKYNARKEKEKAIEYENKIVALIRERYSINQELAILRQKDTKTTEYNEYYAYVEECKAKVKGEKDA